MLRVLQLGPLPPPWGGVQTNLDGIRQFLLSQGHQTASINLTRHRRPNTDTEYFPASPYALLRLVQRLPHEILHLHIGGELSRRLVGLCFALTGFPGRRTVLSFHSGGYPSSPGGRSASYWTLRGLALRRFDRIIVVNEELREVFSRFGVPPARCQLIPPYWVPPSAPELSAGPLLAFFAAHDPVLLSVGLLEPEYDLPTQLEALNLLRQSHPGAGLLWIGSGSLQGELQRRIAASPVPGAVLLVGDVPRPQTLAAIAKASVLWRTTLYDGDAVSVREGLHFGTPIVATDTGMRPPGLSLIPARDPHALAAATRACLASPRPERRQQDGEANLRQVLHLYEQLAG
jgi:glycosyltransferase involved in cell wall biosynthesis